MIDSTSNNNNGTNGLATALRDRSSCTIPIQPNRSLPVRPAPHITCRSILSKKIGKKSSTNQEQNLELSNNTQGKIQSSSELSVVLSPINNDLHQSLSSLLSSPSSTSSSSFTSSSSSPSSSSKLINRSIIGINENNWNSNIQLPIINIIGVANKKINERINVKAGNMGRLSTKRKINSDVVNNGNVNDKNNMINNYNFIDITKSPERYNDFSIDNGTSTSTCPKSNSILSDDADSGIITTPKKRRRRKDKKSSNNNVSTVKIVPPLRLKKIQCLQEKNATKSIKDNWNYVEQPINVTTLQEPTIDIGFQYYHPNLLPKKQIVRDNMVAATDDWTKKYRIVTDQTTPYIIDIQNQSSLVMNNNDDKLRYRQNILQLKLCELKKKTVELGREMLKTAITSPNNTMQQTIYSYEKQIESLNNLLRKIPETSADSNITIQIPESVAPSTIDSSPSFVVSSTHTLTSHYCDSSQSPGPPKLSPELSTDIIIKSQSERQNRPHLLPEINLNNDDDCLYWAKSEYTKQISKSDYEKSYSAGVTTTSECTINEELDIDNKPEVLELTLDEIIKSNTNTDSTTRNITVNEQESDEKIQEINDENVSSFTNSHEIIIDTTNNVIEKLVIDNNRTTSPKITSSCDTLQNSQTNQSTINSNNNDTDTANSVENNLISTYQFPSLSKWLTNSYSTKKMFPLLGAALDKKKVQKPIINDKHMPVIQSTSIDNVNHTRNINTPSDTSSNKSSSERNLNVNVTQCNNEQGQSEANTDPQNSTANANISIGPDQFCPPVPLTGLYAGNYPINPYGQYNYNHPALVTATNAVPPPASIWNNTILQYPFVRQQNILNDQLSNIKANNTNEPVQNSATATATNFVPLQNAAPSPYPPHATSSSTRDDGVTERMPINDTTSLKLPLTNFSKRNGYPLLPPLNPIVLPESSNVTGIQQSTLQQQQPLQENYYRYYHYPQVVLQGPQQQQQPQPQQQQYQIQSQNHHQQQPQQQQPQQVSQQQPLQVPQPQHQLQSQHRHQPQSQQQHQLQSYHHQQQPQPQQSLQSHQPQQQQPQSLQSHLHNQQQRQIQQQEPPQQLQQQPVQSQQPLLQHQAVRYADGFFRPTNYMPINDRSITQMNYRPSWRAPILPFAAGRNYGLRNNWLDPYNLLSTLSPVALQNYATPLSMEMLNGTGVVKEHVDHTRACDTPHLGKVEYNPSISKALKCSNCGRSNPMFKCLGCELTFYCDRACQTTHWNRHVISCPKKMPKLQKVIH